MDRHSKMAIAQQDVEKYYDNLRGLRVVRWLSGRYECGDICATFLKMHSLPTIALRVGSQQALFRNRCVGLFTGSRSAGAAGRLPLLDVAAVRMPIWGPNALQVGRLHCCLATFVDNLLTLAETPEKAIAIMSDCEDELSKRWCLKIGPESKEYMTCRGYPWQIHIPPEWQRRTTLKCLGHRLDDDGGIGSCFSACTAAMSRSFYANLTAGLFRASRAAKYRFLSSCVRTIAHFRWSRWPFTKTYAAKLDGLQRKFLTALMQIRPNVGEPYDAFVQRRHITGGHLASACGRWSRAWAHSVITWDAHVRRAHDSGAWSHALLDCQPETWLDLQRWWHSALGESRTRTRAYRGHVHQRWSAGVNLAGEYVTHI